MKSITVFCGSSDGYNELYREVAYNVGATLAQNSIRVIYGGSRSGLMGAVADGALNNNGEVIGVIPEFLHNNEKEIAHEGLTDLIIVETMHQRKLKMYELCDGIITLPGGWGTMEEMFEMLTWAQLGMHQKPIGLLNINAYYDSLKALFSTMVQEGFLNECTSTMLLSDYGVEELLEQMKGYQAPDRTQVIDKQST